MLRHALSETQRITGEVFDVVVDLDATAPIRRVEDIDRGLQIFREHKPLTIVSVVPARRNPYFNMLELAADGSVQVVKQLAQPLLRRQDTPIVYDMNASIYVYDAQYLLNPNHISAISPKTLPLVMDEYSAFDIDSEEDFQFIEFLVTKGLVSL